MRLGLVGSSDLLSDVNSLRIRSRRSIEQSFRARALVASGRVCCNFFVQCCYDQSSVSSYGFASAFSYPAGFDLVKLRKQKKRHNFAILARRVGLKQSHTECFLDAVRCRMSTRAIVTPQSQTTLRRARAGAKISIRWKTYLMHHMKSNCAKM